MDVTFFRRKFGVMVFLNSLTKKVIYHQIVKTEKVIYYKIAVNKIGLGVARIFVQGHQHKGELVLVH